MVILILWLFLKHHSQPTFFFVQFFKKWLTYHKILVQKKKKVKQNETNFLHRQADQFNYSEKILKLISYTPKAKYLLWMEAVIRVLWCEGQIRQRPEPRYSPPSPPQGRLHHRTGLEETIRCVHLETQETPLTPPTAAWLI